MLNPISYTCLESPTFDMLNYIRARLSKFWLICPKSQFPPTTHCPRNGTSVSTWSATDITSCKRFENWSATGFGARSYSLVLYTQPLSNIVQHHSLSRHSSSDNNQLYKSGHISQLQDIQCMQCCIFNLKHWMTNNKLQLNEDKRDIILSYQGKCQTTNPSLPKFAWMAVTSNSLKVCAA